MPIFRVKSVKIHTGQKNLHWRRRPRRRQLSGMTNCTETLKSHYQMLAMLVSTIVDSWTVFPQPIYALIPILIQRLFWHLALALIASTQTFGYQNQSQMMLHLATCRKASLVPWSHILNFHISWLLITKPNRGNPEQNSLYIFVRWRELWACFPGYGSFLQHKGISAYQLHAAL